MAETGGWPWWGRTTRGVGKLRLIGAFLLDHMDLPYFVCFMDRGDRDPPFHEHMGLRPLAPNQAKSHITVFPGWKVERIDDCPSD